MIAAYCLNHAWTKHLPVQLFALCSNNPAISKIYILCDRIDPDILAQIKPYRIEWIVPPAVFNRLNVRGRFGLPSLWRLLLPNYVREDFCLYLDADTLVRKCIEELADLRPVSVAGVFDAGISDGHLARINHNGGTYINSGVMWMNLANIRKMGLPEAWRKRCNTRKYPLQDQDIINVTTAPMLIGTEYNSSVSTGLHPDPKIVHWAGPKSTDRWVEGLAQDGYWREWQRRYDDSQGDRLRLVRGQPQAGTGS